MEFALVPLEIWVQTGVAICASAGLALLAVILRLTRRESSSHALALALCASALAGPAVATFFAVRQVIAAFQGMAMSGGGLAAVCAGIWEALRPLVYASPIGLLLAVAALVAFLLSSDEETPNRTIGAAGVVTIIVFLAGAVGVGASLALLLGTTRFVVQLLNPAQSAAVTSIAESSMRISRGLTGSAALSTLGAALLTLSVPLAFVTGTHLSSSASSRARTVLFILLVVAVLSVTIWTVQSWSGLLETAARTGQFPS